MSIDQPNAFENKTIIKDGTVDVQEEKRPNIEALEKKRDEYIIEAIKKIEKNNPEKFKKENINFLASEILSLLEEEHNIETSALVSSGTEKITGAERRREDDAIEFLETYKTKHVEELLEKYFAEKTK
jgi:hypothetical protein